MLGLMIDFYDLFWLRLKGMMYVYTMCCAKRHG
jgi:hypothetical protein